MLRTPPYTDTVTLIFIISLSLIALIKLNYTKRLYIYFTVLFSSRYFNDYAKDARLFDRFNTVFYIIFIATLSTLSYGFIPENTLVYNGIGLKSLLFVVFFVLFGFKFLMELLLSKILNIEVIIQRYLFRKISYRNFYGLVLIPITAFIYYHNLFETEGAKYILISLFSIYIISYILILKSFLGLIKQSWLYFILYLCALEISPYIILYKYFI